MDTELDRNKKEPTWFWIQAKLQSTNIGKYTMWIKSI